MDIKNIIINKLFLLLSMVLLLIYIYILGTSIFVPYEYSKYELSWIILVLGLIIGSVLVFIVYKKIYETNDRKLKIIDILSLSIIVIIQGIFIYNIIAIPYMDLVHIHSEALSMLDTGIITNQDYFGKFSNNIPYTILLYNIFKLGNIFNIENFRLLGSLFNIVMIDIAIVVGYLCVIKVRSRKEATLYLVLCMMNPVFYTYGPYYYTDITSMAFMVIALYMYILAKASNKKWKTVSLYMGVGIILVLGFKIRATTMIVGIAILIYKILMTPMKQATKYIGIIIVGGLLAVGLYNNIENEYVKFDYSESSYPVTHWIMMSHQGDGGWNQEDVDFTGSFKTKHEKIEQNLSELGRRMESLGLKGYIELIGKKIQRVWASGTHRYEQYLTSTHEYTKLYNYVLGYKSLPFIYYNQIMHIILIFFIVIGLIENIKRRSFDSIYITKIALFGAILFYIMWEAHPKYSVSFVLFMIIASIDGCSYWSSMNEKFKSIVEVYIKSSENKAYVLSRKRFIKSIFYFRKIIMIFTLMICVMNYGEYTNKLMKQYDFSVKQNNKWGEGIKIVNNNQVVQSFTTDKAFNTVEVNFEAYNKKDNSIYKFLLMDEMGNVIYQQQWGIGDIKDNNYVVFKFNTEVPDGKRVYKISISTENSIDRNEIEVARYSRPYYDVVPTGQLFIDGQEVEGDLMFKVYGLNEKSYTMPVVYIIICFLIIIGEYVIFESYLKWLKK